MKDYKFYFVWNTKALDRGHTITVTASTMKQAIKTFQREINTCYIGKVKRIYKIVELPHKPLEWDGVTLPF